VRQRFAAVALLAVTVGCTGRSTDSRSVVLVTVDTLRADHVGHQGYERRTTPAADRLAATGVAFASAIAQAPETLPSIASILTGTYPIDHGLRENGYVLHGGPRTLAEILRQRGYGTAAFVSSAILDPSQGLARGFDTYDAERPHPFLLVTHGQRRADETTAAAIEWLRRRDRGRPFLLWVHYIDPHSLYDPPAPYDELFRAGPYDGRVRMDPRQFFGIIRGEVALGAEDTQYLIDRYDGEIAFADAGLARLLEALDGLGLDDTLVIYTADHGESLGEHGYRFDHGDYLYENQIRVPLVLRHPRLPAGRVVRDQVELVDIMPTIAEVIGLPHESAWRGRSLLPVAAGDGRSQVLRLAFAESDSCRPESVRRCAPVGLGGKLYALRTNAWKLIADPGQQSVALYDLRNDPGELTDRVAAHPDVAAEFRRHLDRLLASGARAEEMQTVGKETVERLRSLGYVE
jgi:arylsulfatase A-like enzyme